MCAHYYKLGFSEIAIRLRYYADGEHALLLVKDLTGETDSQRKRVAALLEEQQRFL